MVPQKVIIPLLLAIAAIFMAACALATARRDLKPVPNSPDLVGSWKGEYRGHAIQMVVEKQQGAKLSGMVSSPAWSKD